jgi:hypothetical protein
MKSQSPKELLDSPFWFLTQHVGLFPPPPPGAGAPPAGGGVGGPPVPAKPGTNVAPQ